MHLGCFLHRIYTNKCKIHCKINRIQPFEDFQHFGGLFCQPFGESTCSNKQKLRISQGHWNSMNFGSARNRSLMARTEFDSFTSEKWGYQKPCIVTNPRWWLMGATNTVNSISIHIWPANFGARLKSAEWEIYNFVQINLSNIRFAWQATS